MRRHEQEQRSARSEQLAEAAQRLLVVGDVLEDVEADDRVERPLDRCRVALDDRRRLGCCWRSIAASSALGLERDDLVGERQERDVCVPIPAPTSRTRPWIQARAAVDDPGVVGLRPRHRVEVVGEGVGHAWEDTGRARLRPDNLVPALGRRTSPAGSSPRPSSIFAPRASRSTSSRPRASVTSGSRTATGSCRTCARGRGSCSLLPAFLVAFARAARRAARGADVVHAHWIPVGDRRARDRQAVRAPGVGDGRRARAARAVARASVAAPRAACDRGVVVSRRRGDARSARARCA